jgi:hypothetical protein
MNLDLITHMEINSFLTWEFLGTFTGSIAAVTVLTQVIKKYLKIDPKWIALVISLIIMLVAQTQIEHDLGVETFVISIFNALIVTGISISIYETAVKTIAKRFVSHDSQSKDK